jgi:aspartokinase-like uncharacterized kinase
MSDESTLKCCLTTIEQKYKEGMVIVPGGGVYADLIRTTQQQWRFDEETAHLMAILAMKQFALLLKSLTPAFILVESLASMQTLLKKSKVLIWSPKIEELSSINASWEVTSDSLAAWLASQLGVTELILIKSAEIPPNLNVQKMQKIGLVDKAFHLFSKNTSYKITLINKHQFNERNVT